MYLVAILDWYSRYVVSWELDQTLELPFVLSTVECALEKAAPVIWNSDQGSHFTSPQYLSLLQAANVQISMDGKGRALVVHPVNIVPNWGCLTCLVKTSHDITKRHELAGCTT